MEKTIRYEHGAVKCDLRVPADVGETLAKFANTLIGSHDKDGPLQTGLFMKSLAPAVEAALADFQRQDLAESPADFLAAAVNAYALMVALFTAGYAKANDASAAEVKSVTVSLARDFSQALIANVGGNTGHFTLESLTQEAFDSVQDKRGSVPSVTRSRGMGDGTIH